MVLPDGLAAAVQGQAEIHPWGLTLIFEVNAFGRTAL